MACDMGPVPHDFLLSIQRDGHSHGGVIFHMKTFKWFMIIGIVAVSIPLIVVGIAARVARDAMLAGSDIYDDVADWLDRK